MPSVSTSFTSRFGSKIQQFKETYGASCPYNHLQIFDIFDSELMEKVVYELNDIQFKIKETDIYKINQSDDLMDLSVHSRPLPAIQQLRSQIYSTEFRNMIQEITGSGVLSSTKIDLSINRYSKTCHLLNHDDVIGTRRVSFILYLGRDWSRDDGGALELYDTISPGTPHSTPFKTLLPIWNSFCFFKVVPGHSFHAVEEVVTDKDRLSISGWFHTDNPIEPLEKDEKSTLQTLLDMVAKPKLDCASIELQNMPLSNDEVFYLKKYINPAYLMSSTVSQLHAMYAQDEYVVLSKILNQEWHDRMENIVGQYDESLKGGRGFITKHGMGVGQGWECLGPPHLRRYLTLSEPLCSEPAGNGTKPWAMFQELEQLVVSLAFQKWLFVVTGSDFFHQYTAECRRFRPGLDYTLALLNKQPLLHVNLCLTRDDKLWEDGEVGGNMTLMTQEILESHEDAAVYKSVQTNQDMIILNTAPVFNQMVICHRNPQVFQFTKYVSAFAPGSRFDIQIEFSTDLSANV